MQNPKDVNFNDFGLSDSLVNRLKKIGFESPTPIQKLAIPVLLNDHRDIIAQAQTGTGKTAAFGLPIIDSISENQEDVQAIILAPTRELALQVSAALESFIGSKRLKVTTIYGGQSISNQIKMLKAGSHIVVGTPGRVMDLLNQRKLQLKHIRYLVLDEADEMLKQGFAEDVEKIMAHTNSDKRTFLFSATMPSQILHLAKTYMNEHIVLQSKHETTVAQLIDQRYIEVPEHQKGELLFRIIDSQPNFYGLLFCHTKAQVDQVTAYLMENRYKAEAMHGDMSQGQREKVLKKFRNRLINLLVVTDVASRGIDITDLTHVINFSVPQNAETYTHRIGRTGRGGKSGTAITLVSEKDRRKFTQLKSRIKDPIQKEELPDSEHIIENKKQRIGKAILATIEAGIKPTFKEFADSLTQTYDAETVLAALLAVTYENELNPKKYKTIETLRPQFQDRNTRSPRNSRNQRPSRNGHTPRSNNKGRRNFQKPFKKR